MDHKKGITNKLTHVWPSDLCQGPKITKRRKDSLLNNQKKANLWNERKYLQTLNKGQNPEYIRRYYNSTSKQQQANN